VVLASSLAGCGGGGGSGGGSGITIAAAAAAAAGRTLTVNPGAGTGAGGLGIGPAPVNLGMAGNYVILDKASISTTGVTQITGDLGMSPATSTAFTGFGQILDATGCFSTSAVVTGRLYASDYTVPGPCTTAADLTTAINNQGTAFTDANSRAPDQTELGTGNISGMTLPPGTYKWSTGILIPTDVYLSGGPNDVWIFQTSGGITMSPAAKVILLGGALPKNIFWATVGVAAFNTTTHFEGVVLSSSSITLANGASVNGRLLANTGVTLIANTVAQPAP
jgi:hypothetical protein